MAYIYSITGRDYRYYCRSIAGICDKIRHHCKAEKWRNLHLEATAPYGNIAILFQSPIHDYVWEIQPYSAANDAVTISRIMLSDTNCPESDRYISQDDQIAIESIIDHLNRH